MFEIGDTDRESGTQEVRTVVWDCVVFGFRSGVSGPAYPQ